MRHDWIFAVLEDLHRYALANGLPKTAAQAAQTIRIARDEIAAQGEEGGAGGAAPPNGLPN